MRKVIITMIGFTEKLQKKKKKNCEKKKKRKLVLFAVISSNYYELQKNVKRHFSPGAETDGLGLTG